MKQFFLAFARQNQEANKTVAGILEKLSNDDREKDRKSYYKSLSGLFRHNTGASVYFISLFKTAVAENEAIQKALKPLSKIQELNGKLTKDQWKQAVSFSGMADKALIDFINALEDKDFNAPLKIDWYKGKPPAVPLWFMMEQLVSHNIHHRGQISQILDSLKIDNDFSGINVKFL
ncbi:MAG: damage-inducible protein DinB [Treponema sp.]|nr:damage-inducible protein DinB [Treponema sp.]MCL2272234.1 damage-inducible protein DinB [Treponema sp.]